MADGHLIVLSTFLQLAPKWLVSSSLLVAGRVAQEKSYRVALASSLMASLSLEMVWTWFRPEAPYVHSVAVFLDARRGAQHTGRTARRARAYWLRRSPARPRRASRLAPRRRRRSPSRC